MHNITVDCRATVTVNMHAYPMNNQNFEHLLQITKNRNGRDITLPLLLPAKSPSGGTGEAAKFF